MVPSLHILVLYISLCIFNVETFLEHVEIMRDLWIMRGYLPCENRRTREYHIVDYAGSFHWISDYLR